MAEKPKGVVIHSREVKPLVLDETYSSKMILDSVVAGGPSIQMNEGTLAPGCSTGGGVHEKPEQKRANQLRTHLEVVGEEQIAAQMVEEHLSA